MKNFTIIFITFIVVFCLASNAIAQKKPDPANNNTNPDDDQGTQFLIENLVEESDAEEFDLDTEFEYLENYVSRPLDINNASEEELEEFGLLSALQIQGLLMYRRKTGQIYSVYELQGVPLFDFETIRMIMPYYLI